MVERMRRMVAGAILVAAGLAACSGSTVEPPPPFAVNIDASPTMAAAGDTVTFVVNAQGGSLFGVEMDYGDGTGDQYATQGARSAKVTFKHAFAARGAYTCRVTATDALAGQKDASVEVRVN
jgi:hypothetical protein